MKKKNGRMILFQENDNKKNKSELVGVYRRLKKSFDSETNHQAANKAFLSEMHHFEKTKLSKTSYAEQFFFHVQKSLGGFGVNITTPIASLALWLLIVFTIDRYVLLNTNSDAESIGQVFLFLLTDISPIKNATEISSPTVAFSMIFILSLLKILIIYSAFSFGMAVRRIAKR
jgi:hypothetical protein